MRAAADLRRAKHLNRLGNQEQGASLDDEKDADEVDESDNDGELLETKETDSDELDAGNEAEDPWGVILPASVLSGVSLARASALWAAADGAVEFEAAPLDEGWLRVLLANYQATNGESDRLMRHD